jgi:Tol biopolymer transport system component
MKYRCFEIANRPPSTYVFKETFVYSNDDNTDAYLIDENTKNVYRFPRQEGDRLWGFHVSPDRTHIVYMRSHGTQDTVVVAAADGKTVWSQATDSFPWVWFDNERLINLIVPETGHPSLLLLNPFNRERRDLQTDYPNSEMFSNKPYPKWRFTGGGFPIYDPLLTRVIYPETHSLTKGTKWPLILWDTETDKLITKITTMDYWGETPLWTPDGKQFIIATNLDPDQPYVHTNEFFAVSRDGDVRQLTHFLDYYQEVNILDNYNLSPDGKQLAFWITAKPSQFADLRLAVLNIETGKVINYCVKGDPYMDNETAPLGPLWSPDSTQLLIISRNLQNTKIRWVVSVDLAYGYAAKIAEDAKPVGWMVSP